MTAKAVLYIDLDNTLIDNTPNNGASEFEGEWVKFGTDDYPDWPAVTDYLLAELNEMRFFRYRKPSLSTILGVTAAKRSVKRSLGISQVQGFIEPSRLKQKIKYRAGLYTPVARAIRQTAKGKFRTPFGL